MIEIKASFSLGFLDQF